MHTWTWFHIAVLTDDLHAVVVCSVAHSPALDRYRVVTEPSAMAGPPATGERTLGPLLPFAVTSVH